MLRVGIVGFGFMGQTHYKCWKQIEDAEVVAICDVNPNIEEDTKRAVGNIGDGQAEVDFSALEVYSDFDQMLTEANLDAISLTLPTYLHPDNAVKALSAGLHVMCEKPMALTADACKPMIAAAEKSGKVLQIGHCVRFWPEYSKAKEIIDSGEHGRIISATFQRLGAAPAWSIDNWFHDEKRSGGMALDLHIHDADYVQYLFGMPKAVRSVGGKNPGGELVHISTQYLYDNDTAVTAEGGWAMMPAFGFEMSFNIVLEKATLVYDLTRDPMFRLCPTEGEAIQPEVAGGDGWLRQIEHFAKAASGEKVESIITLEESMNSVKIVEAEKESANTGQKVSIG
jgi:predicted dehydrogenase